MERKFSIGQQVRIVNYSHPHCGEFGNVRSVLADGEAAILKLDRFPGRLVSVTREQVCDATPFLSISDTEGFSRASHYSS